MLNIHFGRENIDMDALIINPMVYFKYNKKPMWFDDPFVKEIIKGVDGAEVIIGEALINKYDNGISTLCLSGGTKTLICIYELPHMLWYGSTMGDNCIPFLIEIGKQKDITIMLEHFMDLPDNAEEALLLDGKKATIDDYEEAFCDWSEKIHEED